MGDIFSVFFTKSFRTIKRRFSETIETVLTCTNRVALIIEAIACGVAFSKSETSFCDRLRRCFSLRGFANAYSAISRRLDVESIAACSFYISKIAADSANHYRILLPYLSGILKQNLNITKLSQSIASIATQKTTSLKEANTFTNSLIFQVSNKFSAIPTRLYLIDIILARYRTKIFT